MNRCIPKGTHGGVGERGLIAPSYPMCCIMARGRGNPNLREVWEMVEVKDSQPMEVRKREYQKLVQQVIPRPTVGRNVFWAFVVGGLISLLGQGLTNFFAGLGLPLPEAGSATSAVLVFLSAFLTGIGVYDEIAKFAGAGAIVPITGFANSMVAPAMEYRAEGLVLGVGARLFTVAGPVLVFGIVTAWAIGILYYLFRLEGVRFIAGT